MKFRKIEILEENRNKKGDLFGRLMSDLFHVLGYGESRLSIHKSGREIDLQASHRMENKIAIAECKAHEDAVGGADINKFIGVLDAENKTIQKRHPPNSINTVGYFISLTGFTETAIEQENDLNNRVILINSTKIIEELIRGRIIVSIEKAISSLTQLSHDLTIQDHCDLLAYEKGWVWALYYSDSNGQKTSHVALVHAEGKALIKKLADDIVAKDNSGNNYLSGLTLINKEEATKISAKHILEAKGKYFKYLENELGQIQFEGMPTDNEAGSIKVKLENIFVPLHFIQSKNINNKIQREGILRRKIGNILNKESRLAILAKPGGGKSTLIKRIAIAYAFPERRNKIGDNLPKKDWFPIFLRCRELGEKVTQSITEIIKGIPIRAEIHSCTEGFSALVSEALQNGTALFLVDGLDEISEDKNRIAFANQLRTFIATYPSLNIIITSREAGFRSVAGSLASYCKNYTVANLRSSEIEELCLKWHKVYLTVEKGTRFQLKSIPLQ